ncbi:MAG: adenylate/guanylate cyclase domain-containing protein [Spirochaetaceae bacterium]|jgi:class 3 adenylate cyclase|nr:adenylate/guanylate cyclase domain-containing protein [Spirochaetaceae bacterium]
MKNASITTTKNSLSGTKGRSCGIRRPLSVRFALCAVLPLPLFFCAAVVYTAAGKTDGAAAIRQAVYNVFWNGTAASEIKIAAAAAVFILLVYIILYIYFHSVFKRITHLSGVLNGIRKGVYTEPEASLPPDEIGALAAAVNNLSKAVQSEKLCRTYKLNNLYEHEKPAGTPFSGEGERAAACLMYIEIDRWMEKPFYVPSKRLIALLVKYYDIVSDCACKTGGSIESYFDSSVNILWNRPQGERTKLERDIYNCARCALFIRYALFQYNKKQKNPALRIKANIGIHYGPVTAGLIKINRGEELKVTGSSLITARTAAACAVQHTFDILISGTARHFVEDYLITEQLTPENGEETAGGLYALINIKNPQRINQKHPRTVEEVRKIIYLN